MLAYKLKIGDTVGIVSPSHIASVERYGRIIAKIKSLGFNVKTGENIYKSTYGYLASEAERAYDFNKMILDDTVKMIFFGGGSGAIELLPYIDYAAVKRNPKIFLSYSDGTSILNAIYSKTGLITYYGQTPGDFEDLRYYTYEQFASHFLLGNAETFVSNSEWYSLYDGICEGTLIGGYTLNFALLLNSCYFKLQNKYVLFLEDHEKFNDVATVSMFLSHIEQNEFINRVSGLIFGHYSEIINQDLMERLKRFGAKHNIPVAYCDDFGHGTNHAILPIGKNIVLNTIAKTLKFVNEE